MPGPASVTRTHTPAPSAATVRETAVPGGVCTAASVRGYADLFQYAAANEPAERDRHLARLRAEAARMGVLLDDLPLLARLDAAEAGTPLRCADTT